ncbi:MAG: HPr family phosphocarrier protein [Pseudomonadota bacterium]
MPSRTLSIVNAKGLHARASARFVATVEAHDARAWVARGAERVPGDSIMGLLMLAASKGAEIEVETEGPAADALLDALATLIADKFGEDA